jgi:hypothetical protein
MKRIYRIIILLSIALISLTMHYKHFSKDLMSIHVWRQTQTQSTIINFYEEDMNILNPRRNDRGNGDGIFRMEFPLMQWMVACTYKIFGNHLILSRIFMFIVGLFSILGIYRLLAAIFRNNTLALIGAWTFNFSPSFYYYTINPLPDNLALCCSIWGIALFFSWFRKGNVYLLLFSGILLSIGALCKLPFILYFIVPLTYFLIEIIKNRISKDLVVKTFGVSIFVLLPLAWYYSVVPHWHGNGIVNGILNNNVPFTIIIDYLQSNLISTLPELLLNYGSLLFFISGFYFLIKNRSFKNPMFPIFSVWSIAILSYFIFEINMIAKIHDYYLFPFYPILFILVSYGAYNLLCMKNKFIKYLTLFLLLMLPITAYLRMHTRWNSDSPGFNKDLLTYKDELRSAAPKDALCIAGNDGSHFIFFYYIDKKGWGFDSDNLNAQNMRMMIENGASYLYSDSRIIDTNKVIIQVLDKLVMEKGSVRVYSLKKNKFGP